MKMRLEYYRCWSINPSALLMLVALIDEARLLRLGEVGTIAGAGHAREWYDSIAVLMHCWRHCHCLMAFSIGRRGVFSAIQYMDREELILILPSMTPLFFGLPYSLHTSTFYLIYVMDLTIFSTMQCFLILNVRFASPHQVSSPWQLRPVRAMVSLKTKKYTQKSRSGSLSDQVNNNWG